VSHDPAEVGHLTIAGVVAYDPQGRAGPDAIIPLANRRLLCFNTIHMESIQMFYRW